MIVNLVAETPSPPSRAEEDAWCAALVVRLADGDATALEKLYAVPDVDPPASLRERVLGAATLDAERGGDEERSGGRGTGTPDRRGRRPARCRQPPAG